MPILATVAVAQFVIRYVVERYSDKNNTDKSILANNLEHWFEYAVSHDMRLVLLPVPVVLRLLDKIIWSASSAIRGMTF